MLLIRVRGNDAGGYKTFLTLTAGDTVDVPVAFDVLDSVEGTYEAIDLTGYDARMTIGLAEALELTIGNGGIVVDDAPNGLHRIYVADSVTAGWSAGVYAFDYWLINPSGESNCYIEGYITVKGEVA